MPTPPGVVRFTEPFLDTFLPVPPVQAGVCRLCHGAADPGDDVCWSCRRTATQVTRPVGEVVPICLCEAHGQLHYLLRKYKDGPPDLRRRLRPRVAGLIGRFLAEHEQCLGPWDIITTVPSGQSRQGTHPLVTALHMLPLRTCHRRLLHADPAAPRGEHLAASDDRFTLTEEVADARILLIDDTFTSGAALQSAASACSWQAPTSRRSSWAATSSPSTARSCSRAPAPASRSGSTAAAAATMTGEADKGRPPRAASGSLR
jgi:predicted amidophosphoribosyltransferase